MYLAEMFCDRVGATKVYMGEAYDPSAPLAYFERNLGHYRMHEKTAEDLGLLLRMLAERGEDETCAYVRENVVKKNRKNRS